MAVSSGGFSCMPLTPWDSRLLRKGGGFECSCFVHLCYSHLAQCLIYPVGQGNGFLTLSTFPILLYSRSWGKNRGINVTRSFGFIYVSLRPAYFELRCDDNMTHVHLSFPLVSEVHCSSETLQLGVCC